MTPAAWIYAPLLFILWLVVFYSVRGFLFYVLRKWGQKRKAGWDEFLIKTLRLPSNILILGGGLALLERLLPLPRGLDEPTAIAIKVLVIIAVFFLLDRLVVQLLRHFAGKVQAIDLSRGIIQGLVRLTILSFGLLLLLDVLGISITPLVASLSIHLKGPRQRPP